MATQITQREENGRTYLHVEGEMLLEDALLLEKIVGTLEVESDNVVAVDLADLDFLDSDSAQVLRRLKDHGHCHIEGIEIFLQTAVNAAERSANDRPAG